MRLLLFERDASTTSIHVGMLGDGESEKYYITIVERKRSAAQYIEIQLNHFKKYIYIHKYLIRPLQNQQMLYSLATSADPPPKVVQLRRTTMNRHNDEQQQRKRKNPKQTKKTNTRTNTKRHKVKTEKRKTREKKINSTQRKIHVFFARKAGAGPDLA